MGSVIVIVIGMGRVISGDVIVVVGSAIVVDVGMGTVVVVVCSVVVGYVVAVVRKCRLRRC